MKGFHEAEMSTTGASTDCSAWWTDKPPTTAWTRRPWPPLWRHQADPDRDGRLVYVQANAYRADYSLRGASCCRRVFRRR